MVALKTPYPRRPADLRHRKDLQHCHRRGQVASPQPGLVERRVGVARRGQADLPWDEDARQSWQSMARVALAGRRQTASM
jgi:hypothetical protein